MSSKDLMEPNLPGAVTPSGFGGRLTVGNSDSWLDGRSLADAVSDLEFENLPPALLKAWQDDGAGLAFRVGTATAALAVLDDLYSFEQQRMLAGFDRLSEELQTVILNELGQGLPGFTRSVPEKALDAAASTDWGIVLEHHWGGAFKKKMSVLAYRWDSIRSQLNTGGQHQLDAYFDNMTHKERIAACIIFTGG